MEAIHIILIITGCLAPLLLGGGYGISQLLKKSTPSLTPVTISTTRSITPTTTTSKKIFDPCSITRCPNNEICRKHDNGTSYCQCSPNLCRNNITNKCEFVSAIVTLNKDPISTANNYYSRMRSGRNLLHQGYEWVNYEAKYVNDTRLALFTNQNGLSRAIARRVYKNGDVISCALKLDRRTSIVEKVNCPIDHLDILEFRMSKTYCSTELPKDQMMDPGYLLAYEN
ncbi:hypothetical protein PV328_007961 [Microctonus aethiopoides]|uniref:Uncharacterized protein n=1 Tax=Microctonus aethiopoides TaxID=144406 RepID=A0AA39CA12_9HYME|nr:hypothetical protein PV328_007961 [Microctonus aethiopoides]